MKRLNFLRGRSTYAISPGYGICRTAYQTIFFLTLAALLYPQVANAQIPPNTRLLTTSIRTGNTEVFWINPATGDAFNITKAPNSEERYPVWSPDGKQVAFTSNRAGATVAGTFNLYIANADGTNVRQLTTLPARNVPAGRNANPAGPPVRGSRVSSAVYYFPSWTADGRQIWFSLADDAQGKAVIGYVTPDGKDYKEVANGRDGAISPDGKTVAFTKQVGKGYCVFAMDANGDNVRQLTQHEDEIGAVAPTWSFDGKQILYSDQVGEALELFIYDLGTKQSRQLTSLGKISSSGAWSPDGKWVTFRVTGDAYWRNATTRDKAYEDKQPDKRPVWMVSTTPGSSPFILEPLRYHCAIDGSRAAWQPGQ